MIVTGVVYAFIGIKKRWLHVYFSAAYLTALGTTVLIVYVMSLPVSNAVQGGYVVAAVCTGLVLGGLALLFQDITEGMGCMLGGFCISMWLLCLHKGGLLQSSAAKIIFIVAFTLGVFAFYCTHWTRQYALIICISFSGATVTVLGIDAFSRAGLKEFWAYIWDINSNLFPLGVDTYPLTKGIRVELAATIVIFLASIVSQLKLWHIVQERRKKQDAERAEDERSLRREEEDLGRQIEKRNARERRKWEAKYGSKEFETDKHVSTVDSGLGDMETENGVPHGEGAVTSRPSRPQSQVLGADGDVKAGAEPIELEDMQAQPKSAAEMVLGQDEKDGAVVVCVAEEDYPEGMQPPETAETSGAVAATQDVSAGPVQKSMTGVKAAGPEIVPLPFKIPAATGEETGDKSWNRQNNNDVRSSVATFADEEDEIMAAASPRRRSLASRLSQGPTDLLRSLSERPKRASITLGRDNDATQQTGSREELLIPPQSDNIRKDAEEDKDDNSSLAATVDDISSNDNYSVRDEEEDADASEEQSPRSIEVNAKLSDSINKAEPATVDRASRLMSAETISTSVLDFDKLDQIWEAAATPNHKAPSAASAESPSVSLTKERLPSSLSRIALSYRTNEWAKHLGHADTPEPDALQLPEAKPQPQTATVAEAAATEAATESVTDTGEDVVPTPTGSAAAHDNEVPRPVNVDELQQTAVTGTPPPAAPRRVSMPNVTRSSPYQSLGDMPTAVRGGVAGGFRSVSSNHAARHAAALHHEPIAEGGGRVSPASPTAPGMVPHSGPQTLMGRREMLIQSKSQGFYIGGPITQQAEAMASMANLGGGGAVGLGVNMSMPTIPASGGSNNSSGSMQDPATVDLDEVPMSKRRELMMRQQSYANIVGAGGDGGLPLSASMGPVAQTPMAGKVTFDSHQPKRGQAKLTTSSARQSQLAAFRSSVALDLRGSVQAPLQAQTLAQAHAGSTGLRESMSGQLLLQNRSASAASLQRSADEAAHVRQTIEVQRNYMLHKREAEAQQREMERQDKARAERAFDERMRRGDMMEAHRDAMRRMQASTREL